MKKSVFKEWVNQIAGEIDDINKRLQILKREGIEEE